MSRQLPLYQWADTLASRLPALSKSQAFVLALYGFGMALAHGRGLAAVALALAPLLGRPDNTLRQRPREFYKPKDKKAGRQRRQLEVADCFPLLLAWALSRWDCRRLALALDVTNLGARFHVLCVRAGHIPVGRFVPERWPEPQPVTEISEHEFRPQMTYP